MAGQYAKKDENKKYPSLYELTGEYIELLELLEDPDSDEESVKDAMNALITSIDKKFDGYMKVYREIEHKEQDIKEEMDRLKERKENLTKRKEGIKDSILMSMLATNRTKVETALFTAAVKTTQDSLVIDDEDDIPEEFFDPQPSKLNKKRLKDFLKSNDDDEVEYAHLEKGKTVTFS